MNNTERKGKASAERTGTLTKQLNMAEVETIFAENAVLYGTHDGMAIRKARDIFGDAAIEFVRKMDVGRSGSYINGYGKGSYTSFYLTKAGVLIAATFWNVTIDEAETGGKWGFGEENDSEE